MFVGKMRATKLWEWLEMLDAREQRRLQRFVHSPYFNANPDLGRLLDLLLANEDDKSTLWTALFPGEAYDDLRLRHLCSDLLELCAQELAMHRLREQASLQEVEVLRSLRTRGADGLYTFFARKYARRQDAQPPATAEDFLLRHRSETEQNAWLEQHANRSGTSRLQEALDHLDDFYILSKLKYACTALNNQKVVDQPLALALMPALLAHVDARGEAAVPLVRIYRQLYHLLLHPAETSAYDRLCDALDRALPDLPEEEARDLHAFVMNYCIGQINQGEAGFLRALFDRYKVALARGYLLEAGRLSPWNYKNITVTGLRLSEFAWVEDFIPRYRDLIAPEHRENAYVYNLARLNFQRGRYTDCLQLLQRLEFSDVFYSLDSRVMLLKVYYEQGELRALDALIDSFRVFLHRNRLISAAHRTNYLNLLRFVKKLGRLRPGDVKRLAAIRAEVAATGQVADLGWLREKLEELG